MHSTTFSPLSTSSFQPFAYVSPPLVSSNRLFNHSKGERDYRERTRITFPGGWNHEDDVIFQWCHSQPHRRFNAIEYCKEKTGVQHEFIRVLLQTDQGDLVRSYCHIERVADFERRIQAITNQGTTAFDFVQTIDLGHPIDPEHPELSIVGESNIELVAQITLPRVFDLVDILAICFGMHEHPQAKNYTLQQFNCYFFCWTIILSLARHAVNWNDLLPNHIETLRQDVHNHLLNLRSCGNFTVWSIMFGLHGDQSNPNTLDFYQNPETITEKILSNITGEAFIHAVQTNISALLWHDQDPIKIQDSLGDVIDAIAQDTSSSMLDARFVNSGNMFLPWPPILFHSEFMRICATTWVNRVTLSEHCGHTSTLKSYYAQYAKHIPLSSQVRHTLIAFRTVTVCGLSIPLVAPIHVAVFLANAYEHEVSIQRQGGTKRYLWKPIALARTVTQGPRTAYTGLKWRWGEARYHYHSSKVIDLPIIGGIPPPPKQSSMLHCAVRVLSESLNIYSARHRKASIKDLRRMCAETMEYCCAIPGYFHGHHSLSQLWTLSFRDDVGKVIVQSILNILQRHTLETSYFQWAPQPTSGSETNSSRLTHTELQNRIRNRIIQLSRWEVEGSPIALYMRHVTFTIPAKESQEEMERAIEDVWRTCGPLMT